jgi:hypothetical protein
LVTAVIALLFLSKSEAAAAALLLTLLLLLNLLKLTSFHGNSNAITECDLHAVASFISPSLLLRLSRVDHTPA